MKKRYYLRGLGMGILFTALLFMAGGKSEPAMSDEMIIERAKELGMTESTVLADIGNGIDTSEPATEDVTVMEESMEASVPENAEEATDEETSVTDSLEETTDETVSETVEETESEEEAVAEEPEISSEEVSAEEESAIESIQTGQMISVVVNKGEGSDTVSRRLHELGLVDDSYEFDRYLMQNGYDKRIGAGEHMIPAGASWQEIAKLLTN